MAWPVTLAEAKRALDLGDTTTEDDEINELIPAAVEMVEKDCLRAIANQTWQLKMDEFPCDEIQLRMPPVMAVTSVTYIDTDGTSQTFSSSLYDTDLTSAPGRIRPNSGSTGWPETQCTPNAVTVTFTAGYDSDIPRIAWKAILLALKSLYFGCDVGDGYWSMINRLRWEGGV